VLIEVALPLIVIVIMFSLGLGRRLEDFTRIYAQPKAFAVGAFNQFVMAPVSGGLLAIQGDTRKPEALRSCGSPPKAQLLIQMLKRTAGRRMPWFGAQLSLAALHSQTVQRRAFCRDRSNTKCRSHGFLSSTPGVRTAANLKSSG
jgi:hypothetical protein